MMGGGRAPRLGLWCKGDDVCEELPVSCEEGEASQLHDPLLGSPFASAGMRKLTTTGAQVVSRRISITPEMYRSCSRWICASRRPPKLAGRCKQAVQLQHNALSSAR